MSKAKIELISDQELLEKYFINHKGRYYIELEWLAKLPFERMEHTCLDTFHAVQDWIVNYLTQPHPQLGREGAVCPFVKACVAKKSFFLTAFYGNAFAAKSLAPLLYEWKEIFKEIQPISGRESMYRTLLVLFPDLEVEAADALFKDVVSLCKTSFVEEGLMLGEFHKGPPEKYALHNKDFKPLFSPMPLLAIREMVHSDIAFLRDDETHYQAYVRKFGEPKTP